MKAREFLEILMILFIVSCSTNNPPVPALQLELHREIGTFFKNSSEEISKKIFEDVQILKKQFEENTSSDGSFPTNNDSSFYMPSSATDKEKLIRFQQASKVLDPRWKILYDSTGYLSWLYAYDHESKGLRIYPATNTQAIFGPNLTFENFDFYKTAVSAYPNGRWTNVKEDINGTGRIIMYSQAVRLNSESTEYVVIAYDLQTDRLLKRFHEQILSLANIIGSNHIFFISYKPNGIQREIACEYSSNPNDWKAIKSQKGRLLNISDNEMDSIISMESNTTGSNTETWKANVLINKMKFNCSLGYVTSIPVFTLFCSQVR
jgi:hypothetical protein